jgi:UDP-2,3-diacylglucosamine hydrolase
LPVYFASDMHLRLDQIERAHRLAGWVDGLSKADSLYLVGDICDFWYASRQRATDPMSCPGLRSLADFRSRGGELTVMVGNHDLWLGPFYEQVLGAQFVTEPHTVEAFGIRLYLVHGHRTGGRQPWKAAMETETFLNIFSRLPLAIARKLDYLLNARNDATRAEDEVRLVKIYRGFLEQVKPAADVAVFGHVHSPVDDPSTCPRLVVLGSWHGRDCYLRVDDEGATHFVTTRPPTKIL